MNEPDQDVDFVEPVFAPWDGRRVPVVLLGGYLGAGKTTLINGLLRRTAVPIAVLVNDVGDINIDAELIGERNGDTLDLTGGCVCCSLKNGFLEAFDEVRNCEIPPDLVVVELSGIANPRAAAALCGTPGFGLDSIVVLVDLDNFLDRAAADSPVAESLVAQVRSADVLILTKRDLVGSQREDEVRGRLAELAPDTPILELGTADTIAGLLGLAARRPADAGEPAPTLFDRHKTDLIPIPSTIRRAELESLVLGLGPEVVRAKAIVQVETGELLLVQRVGNRTTIEPLPMAECQPTTDLVVVSV